MKAFEFFSAKRQQFAQRAQAAFAQYKEAKKQRGMTLLEVIIVLGIIGTIAAGVVVLAQRAFDSRTVSTVVQDTNTIRVAIKDAYSSVGVYPVADTTAILGLTSTTILNDKNAGATSTLVQLGKVSAEEMRNKISGDFYAIVPGHTSGTNRKGYAIEINGLNTEQCRAILGQVGNNWDYVQVPNPGSAAGAYSVNNNGVEMFEAAQPTTGPVLRSLGNNGNTPLSPTSITAVCNSTGATNSIILGSR